MNPYLEFDNRDGTPSSTEPNEASNQPARTALVLGITSFALIPAFALLLWAGVGDVQLDTTTVTVFVYLISVVAAIGAALFGMQGRRLAKEGAAGWVAATIGLVLGIGFFVVTVLGGIVGFIAFVISARSDSM